MTKLLITDMDGTLVDSMEFLRELAIALVAADGHSALLMREVYDETFGKPIFEQLMEWNRRFPLKPIDVGKLVGLYENVHLLAARNFPVMDFCRALAHFNHEEHHEWKFALVTSTHRKIVDRMSQIRSVRWTFIGGYRGIGTEKYMQIMQALEACQCSPADAMYVGDAPSDLVLAKSVHIPYFFPDSTLVQRLLGQQVFTGITG